MPWFMVQGQRQVGSPLYSTWEVVTRHLFNSNSCATSVALVDVCTAQSVIFIFLLVSRITKKNYSPSFHKLRWKGGTWAAEGTISNLDYVTLQLGLWYSYGYSQMRDKSYPCHWVHFTRHLFNGNSIVELWLQGYEFDFGQGLTELKGTVGLQQRCVFY